MTSVTFLSSKLEETGCPRRPMRRLPETVVTVTDLVKLPGMPEMASKRRRNERFHLPCKPQRGGSQAGPATCRKAGSEVSLGLLLTTQDRIKGWI